VQEIALTIMNEDFKILFLVVIILVGTLFAVLAGNQTAEEVAKLRLEIHASRVLAGVAK
jgi:hypothetical protein